MKTVETNVAEQRPAKKHLHGHLQGRPRGAVLGLHGLLRVRNLVQDDAHIFCSEDPINSETVAFCRLLLEIYDDFGFLCINSNS